MTGGCHAIWLCFSVYPEWIMRDDGADKLQRRDLFPECFYLYLASLSFTYVFNLG